MGDQIHELIIIGSGPAGLTAAIYASRADMKPLLFAGEVWGGQLMNTTEVENFPGFENGIMGPELMNQMIKQAKRFGTDIKYKYVTKVDFSGEIKKVFVDDQMHLAQAVIIATGSNPRMLGLASESKLWGKGVSSCATCDGAFYREKTVAVIGGGDSAMEEADFLTKFASKVYVIHRRDSFKASQIMQDRVMKNEKIEIIWDTEVLEILGDEKVTGAKLSNMKTKAETTIDIDGFFLAIGHLPNTGFLDNSLELDNEGYIKVYDGTHTSVEGVFVAGDVKDARYQQAITAAGMGCMAALDVERWLAENKD